MNSSLAGVMDSLSAFGAVLSDAVARQQAALWSGDSSRAVLAEPREGASREPSAAQPVARVWGPPAWVRLSVRARSPWVAANPFSWLVGRLRDALLNGKVAPQWDDAVALAIAFAVFFAGRWIFRRLSPHFEDFV